MSLDSTGAPLLFVNDGGALPINAAVFLATGNSALSVLSIPGFCEAAPKIVPSPRKNSQNPIFSEYGMAAQIPLVSCLSSHASSRDIGRRGSDLR